ncbi:MAG: FkbM family methyltransferase [Acidobacteriota bacterium]
MKKLASQVLQVWGQWGKAPGYRYRVVDKYGAALASALPLPSKLPNGCRINCDLRDHVQRQIWFYGAYEPVETYLFSQLLRPGMTVLDVGANVGQYSLMAATAVGATGSVHSFEPVPVTFARLQTHIADNGLADIIRAHRVALWNDDTRVNLGLSTEMADNLGSYSIGTDAATAITDSPVEAPALRLSTYAVAQHLTRLDVIKMDIEGAEPFALAGGYDLIREFRPTILIEVNKTALTRLGSSPAELWGIVSDLGYRAWRIGYSPETCGSINNFEGISQANVLLHYADLPAALTQGWTFKGVLRWARREL